MERVWWKGIDMDSLSSFLNVKEVSSYLAFRSSTLYRMVEEKKIPHYRIGRHIRFKKAEIDEWMDCKKEEVVDVKVEARKVFRSIEKKPGLDVDRIVKKSIDEAKGEGYTSQYGKPDQFKGLRKGVGNGTL
jgi:excisionase family DNA binding protein